MIGLRGVIYHIEALAVTIRITFYSYKKFYSIEKNRFEIFDFLSYFEPASSLVLVAKAYNNLI